MQNDLATNEKRDELLVKERVIEPITENNGNGVHALTPTVNLPIAKQISNEDLIAEEKSLIEKETEAARNYEGFRGYLRLYEVSKVIGMLALIFT